MPVIAVEAMGGDRGPAEAVRGVAQVSLDTDIDCLLVGDSAAMVMHGFPDTLAATVEMMAWHTAAVRRGAPTRFLIGDMPFLSFRKGVPAALMGAWVQACFRNQARRGSRPGRSTSPSTAARWCARSTSRHAVASSLPCSAGTAPARL